MSDRYVYMLADGEVPFYVGKGTHVPAYTNMYRRPVEHLHEAQKPTELQTNKLKCAYINKLLSTGRVVNVVVMADGLSEEEAVHLETKLIKQHKRLFEGGTLTNLVSTQPMMAHERRNKQVFCYTTDGGLICEYESIRSASRTLNISAGSIVCCCKGVYNTAGGYVWSYTNIFPGYVSPSAWNKRPVDCYASDLTFVCSFESACDAERETGIPEYQINKCVRGAAYAAGGYVWVQRGQVPVIRERSPAGKPKRPIIQYNKDGTMIKRYNSLSEAMSQTGFTGIARCATGLSRTAGGYKWAYEEQAQ